MGGLDVLSELGEDAASHNIEIFTASEYSDKELQALKGWHGKIERVTKPFADEELLAVVERHVVASLDK